MESEDKHFELRGNEREVTDIAEELKNLDINCQNLLSNYMEESLSEKVKTQKSQNSKCEDNMANMTFAEVAEYIGTLRSTIRKLQDMKPNINIGDQSDTDHSMENE